APPSPLLGLTLGARGDAVRSLQQSLIAAGVAVRGGADGVFGAATAAAVSEFQAANGLPATGRVDEAPPSPLLGLTLGARGDAVRSLQQSLIAAGVAVRGGADGFFGPATAAALTSFQQARGIAASPAVDQATIAALGSPGTPTAPAPASPAPAAPAASTSLAGLRVGATGDAVRALQRALIAAGVNVVGGADGRFGPRTADAVSRFQSARQLPATGQVDDATASALTQAGAAPSTPAAAGSSMVGLAPGAVGNLVKAVQQAIIDAGIRVPGGADGIFGPATANALRTFQAARNLAQTGRVDQATADALAAPAPATAPTAGSGSSGAGFAAYGERSDRVKALQQALLASGQTVRGGADGVFGSATASAVMNFQRARGLTDSGTVAAATATALGLTAQQAPATTPAPPPVTIQAFPMQGRCWFGDTWMAPRGGGRLHEGVDIGGAEGLYLYAVADGTITRRVYDTPGSLSGNALRLTTSDGTYFFYAHLSDVAPGITVGTKVTAGQIIGFNGRTGNAGVPHLHFEVHPGGGAAVNPFPIVKAVDGCSTTTPPPQPVPAPTPPTTTTTTQP
ncbi:MAG: peptidoglycan-binding protein, partial [Ilumatobacteraceae bacterium]|nr:peptidoglycan-binding protein [Ilumatobacteraceae bacterium]